MTGDDEAADDGLMLALAEHRVFCDSGRRYSLRAVAERYGLDLDQLQAEIEAEDR